MWTMGYNDTGEFNFSDSAFNGRKLRPLIPRPLPSVTTTSSSTSASFSRIHSSNDFFTQYQHLATLTDQSKREFNTPPVVVSSRWNPTPEQLRSLEELYRRGTRTPSADQIQHITAQLRRFGKIEGKNVFYWFQNHKARERQKRRRQMESVADDQPRDYEIFERKDSGAGRTDQYEQVEQTKNWAPPKNCSSLAEESVSMERAAKAAVTECRTDGRIQLDETRKNATWQVMMQSSSCPSTIKPNTSCTAAPSATVTMDLNMNFFCSNARWKTRDEEDDDGCRRDSDQTLQLFPLSSYSSDVKDEEVGGKERGISTSAINENLAPFQFFEFLPLKN